MNANDKQIAGDHYKTDGLQCWDFIEDAGLGFIAGNAVKYIFRFDKKGQPTQDLEKAIHYLEKWMEKQPPVHGTAIDAHRLLSQTGLNSGNIAWLKFTIISHIINGVFCEEKRDELQKAIEMLQGRIRMLKAIKG